MPLNEANECVIMDVGISVRETTKKRCRGKLHARMLSRPKRSSQKMPVRRMALCASMGWFECIITFECHNSSYLCQFGHRVVFASVAAARLRSHSSCECERAKNGRPTTTTVTAPAAADPHTHTFRSNVCVSILFLAAHFYSPF